MMEEAVKAALDTKTFTSTGFGGSGCISTGMVYLTDTGSVFVKVNHENKAEEMFRGEKAGLEAILATKTVKVPKPICVVPFGRSSCALVMEYCKIGPLNNKTQAALGDQLADLHLHNIKLWENQRKEATRVTSLVHRYNDDDQRAIVKFGFGVPTSCGYILQSNNWDENWTSFFIRQKLSAQIDELLKQQRDTELKDTWELCMPKIENHLNQIKVIPALLHGDLWSGNAGAVGDEPIIYDPAAFYGHHEYDLGIANMFGGFSQEFYEAYHRKLPRIEGLKKRLAIYELFHHLNHWNHFGVQYRRSTLRIMSAILKDK